MSEAQLNSQGLPVPEAVLRHGAAYPHDEAMEGMPGFVTPEHSYVEEVGEANSPTIAVGLNEDQIGEAYKDFIENPGVSCEEIEAKYHVARGYIEDDVMPNVWKMDESRNSTEGKKSTHLPKHIKVTSGVSTDEFERLKAEHAELQALIKKLLATKNAEPPADETQAAAPASGGRGVRRQTRGKNDE